MLTKTKISLFLALVATTSLPLYAHTGYWQNPQGEMVKTGHGKCWQNSNWTSDKAMAECEGGMKMMDADHDGVMDGKDMCPDTPSGTMVNSKGCNTDSDNDGVVNASDSCPDTAAGIHVNANGCPVDSDADGAADSYDRCPDTPAGIRVDATGCPMDSDGDGAADSYDKCPGTPAGTEVDATGCAVNMDNDNDGIINANDACPDTTPGTVVNNSGCKLTANIALDHVKFRTGTAVLDSESRNILDKIATTLIENSHLKFEVAGHTDSTGNYQANVNLSESRAQSVRQYLVNQGVAANRLTAHGYGPDKPVASNETRDGRSQNRRVELVLQ